jgi:hypothetical protein
MKHPDIIDNVYAYSTKDEIVYIEDALSGRQGYFCMGCKKEMVAVRRKIAHYQSYFRHDAQAVKREGKCTYSDESYRHKLAKMELFTLKQIKVPPVYKFPPPGTNGLAVELATGKIITANSVALEMPFFEDDEGNVKWGRKETEGRNLVIIPDVTFFDASGQPILFIEIVATHKPNADKLLKLMHLGIDAVAVTIPKSSPDEIASTFHHTANAKWIYNYEQETTEYVRPSDGDTAGVSHIDEVQRRLFAESFKCRQAQIRNLIRRIRKCLESEPCRGFTEYFISEISRVEGNTKELRFDLERKAVEHREAISAGYQDEKANIGRRRIEIAERRNQIERENADLEKRYLTKDGELEEKGRVLESRVQKAIRKNGGDGANFEARRTALIRARDSTAENISLEELSIGDIQQATSELPSRFAELREGLKAGFEQTRRKEESAIAEERIRGAEFPSQFKRKEEELESEFKSLRELADKTIEKRLDNGNSELSRDIKRSLLDREFIGTITTQVPLFNRIKAARECIKNRDFESWV